MSGRGLLDRPPPVALARRVPLGEVEGARRLHRGHYARFNVRDFHES
jgi:hypothetical protein